MIKLTPINLCDLYSEAFNRGITMGRAQAEVRAHESTQALLAENDRLKSELSRAETRVMAEEQKDSFLDVRAERLRIKTSIEAYCERVWANDGGVHARELLFALALGGVE